MGSIGVGEGEDEALVGWGQQCASPPPSCTAGGPAEHSNRVPQSPLTSGRNVTLGLGCGAPAQPCRQAGMAVLAGSFSLLFFYFKNSSPYACCHHPLPQKLTRGVGG